MKIRDLQEIFEPAFSHEDVRDRQFSYDNLPEDPDEGTKLGSGTFSRVSDDKSDPHMVTKTQMRKDDGYIADMFDAYAEVIAKEQLWDMIHFPRVYAIKTYSDNAGNKRTRWRMEKLIALSSRQVTPLDVKSLCERYFSDDAYKEIADADFYPGEIVYQIELGVEQEELGVIKDDTLRAACKKLRQIYIEFNRTSATMLDLHDENLMYRRSHTGLDIVFSDPFVKDIWRM